MARLDFGFGYRTELNMASGNRFLSNSTGEPGSRDTFKTFLYARSDLVHLVVALFG